MINSEALCAGELHPSACVGQILPRLTVSNDQAAVRKPHPINPKSHNHSISVAESWQVFSDSLWCCSVECVPLMGSISENLPDTGICCRGFSSDKPTRSCEYLAQRFLRLYFQAGKCFGDVHPCYSIEREEAALW